MEFGEKIHSVASRFSFCVHDSLFCSASVVATSLAEAIGSEKIRVNKVCVDFHCRTSDGHAFLESFLNREWVE